MNGIIFKAIRLQNRLTQKEFGDLLGLSSGMVAHIETGRRAISASTRARLAQSVPIGEEFLSFFTEYQKMNKIIHNITIDQIE